MREGRRRLQEREGGGGFIRRGGGLGEGAKERPGRSRPSRPALRRRAAAGLPLGSSGMAAAWAAPWPGLGAGPAQSVREVLFFKHYFPDK